MNHEEAVGRIAVALDGIVVKRLPGRIEYALWRALVAATTQGMGPNESVDVFVAALARDNFIAAACKQNEPKGGDDEPKDKDASRSGDSERRT